MFTKKKDKFMVQLEEMVFNLDRAAVEFGKMDFNTHLKLFKEQELYRKANSLPFDDFTKVICDRNIISCSGDLVKSLAKIIGIDNVISTREFISIYTVAGFDRVLFGEINDTIE